MSHNCTSATAASRLFDSLKENNLSVSQLDLSNNSLNDSCMKSLGEYIQSNKHIEEVHIGNHVTDKGVEILLTYLAGNTSLKELWMDRNLQITDKSIPFCLQILNSSHLQVLNIINGGVTQLNELVIPQARNVMKYGATKLQLPHM